MLDGPRELDSPPDRVALKEMSVAGDDQVNLGPDCPYCGEPSLRGTNLAARYRCVSCLHRFELRSECPNCGAHSTIARMSDTANVICRSCGGSMLQAI
jgi:DNA-directed RNA polymerase subunit RPC12/RpoP